MASTPSTNPFDGFSFDADDAISVLRDSLAGADDGELFLETERDAGLR